MSGKSIVAIRCFLIPKRNNSGFGKLDRRIYRRHREIRFCPAETSKIAPKAYSRKWPWLFPCFSKTQRERRCQPYPVCLNISRENGRSFLEVADGRNITRYAESAKGAASRASVPLLSYISDECSMNNANETRAEFNHLIAVAQDTGCAIVIIAHIKQSQTAKKPLERIIKDVCRHEVLGDFRTGKS